MIDRYMWWINDAALVTCNHRCSGHLIKKSWHDRWSFTSSLPHFSLTGLKPAGAGSILICKQLTDAGLKLYDVSLSVTDICIWTQNLYQPITFKVKLALKHRANQSQVMLSVSPRRVVTFLGRCVSCYGVGYWATCRVRRSLETEVEIRHAGKQSVWRARGGTY